MSDRDDDDLRGDRDHDAPASRDSSGDPIEVADDDVDEPGDDSPWTREELEALLESLGGGGEQGAEELFASKRRESVQDVGYGEDDMEVPCR